MEFLVLLLLGLMADRILCRLRLLSFYQFNERHFLVLSRRFLKVLWLSIASFLNIRH